jgi:GNAT superfamily N-acetyltransferase
VNGSKNEPRLAFAPVTAADFDSLAELRVAAMRASLEHLGRFDPVRARERLRNSFYPEHTHRILCDGVPVGFYTFRPVPEGLRLEHLYIHPDAQNRGIGGRVLEKLLTTADDQNLSVHVGALRDSASNRFYARNGFTRVVESEWDITYRRASASSRAPSLKPA